MKSLILLPFLVIGMVACNSNAERPETVSAKSFKVISHGEVVDLLPHVSQTGITVFDFYADWCPPCKKLDASLAEMKGVYGERLTVVKLDLVDWKSDLAKHFKIADLPYLMVYSADKTQLAAGPSNQVLPELVKKLNQ